MSDMCGSVFSWSDYSLDVKDAPSRYSLSSVIFCFPSYITENLWSRSLLNGKSITFSRMPLWPRCFKGSKPKELPLIFMLSSLEEILFTNKTGVLKTEKCEYTALHFLNVKSYYLLGIIDVALAVKHTISRPRNVYAQLHWLYIYIYLCCTCLTNVKPQCIM